MAVGALDRHGTDDRVTSRRVGRYLLATTFAALMLAACTFDPSTIERTPRDAAGFESSAKSRLAARKGSPSNGAAAQSGAPGQGPAGAGTEMAALEVDLTNFKERLIGLDSDEINDLMGTPSLERAEPPALIWQYRHQVCTVDIFMFDDGGGSTVDHVEVRPASGNNVNEKECFTSLLRNVQPANSSARAPSGASGQQPIAPSTSVNRRPVPSAAPPSGPAQTPSSSRPPTPSTAAPSAAPSVPPPPRAATAAEGDDGLSPEDSDVDFDFGGSTPNANAPPGAPPTPRASAAPPATLTNPSPSAAPSSEAIPTIPDDEPAIPAPGPQSSIAPSIPPGSTSGSGIDIPADDDADFTDPLSSEPAKPAIPAKPPASSVAAPPAPQPNPSGPAALAPRTPSAAATAQPQGSPKGAPKGAAPSARPIEDLDDEDLPPDLLRGRRADDDPANTNDDLVE
jgi:hypothetical protein